MVFEKNVKKSRIEEFECNELEKIKESLLFVSLVETVEKKSLKFIIEIQHVHCDNKNYCSQIVVDILTQDNKIVYEQDEPNCTLMLCEPLCFMKNKQLVGNRLSEDVEFIDSLKLLMSKVDQIDK